MHDLNRRDFLLTAGAGVAALAATHFLPQRLRAAAQPTGFTLPKLPYDYDALEPSIDKETMMIHHDKHHQSYVNNLNAALKDHPEFLTKYINVILRDIKSVPEPVRQAVINNGGGHANHSLFWTIMAKPESGGTPGGDLAKAIDKSFESLTKFQEKLNAAAATRFGSGWDVAGRRQGQPGRRQHGEPGQPALDRHDADPRHRCVGTCLLSEVQKRACRLRQGVVERRQLEGCRGALQSRDERIIVSPTCAWRVRLCLRSRL